MGFFDKLKQGLAKTKAALITPLEKLFSSAEKVDDDFYDELMDVLIMADVGVETSDYIVETLRADLKEKNIWEADKARTELRRIMGETIGEYQPVEIKDGLNVILVIGVNGAGKTTSIGKLASMYKADGKKFILAAADTVSLRERTPLQLFLTRLLPPESKRQTCLSLIPQADFITRKICLTSLQR